MFPPQKIICVSDNNELQLADTVAKSKKQKENYYVYLYTKSISKEGMQLPLSEPELVKYLKNNIFKEIL